MLYSNACMVCRGILPLTHGMCRECYQAAVREMQYVSYPPPKNVDAFICAEHYRGRMREIILEMKFSGQTAWLEPLAQLMLEAWKRSGLPRPEVITAVPISFPHWFKRGFNQSEELAKYIAKDCALPYVRTMRRGMLARTQSSLSAKQRIENTKYFSARKHCDLTGKQVLLVDDIVTTGATATACARLLRGMGAEHVQLLTAAQTT